jgi:hypothetical protein
VLGMCYIIFTTRRSVCVVLGARVGGWGAGGVLPGEVSPNLFLEFFSSVFSLIHGFLILVKELGLLTHSGQWIRVLDVVESYIYCIINNEDMMNKILDVWL